MMNKARRDAIFERPQPTVFAPRRLADLARPYREPEPDDSPDSEQYSE
jgi:hypothetical protein